MFRDHGNMTALKYRAGLLSASEHRLEKSKNTLRTQDFQISISTKPVHQVLVHGFQWPNSSLRCKMKVAQNFVLIWLILTHFCYLCAVAMKGQIQCKLRKHHQIKKKCCKSKQKKTEFKKKQLRKGNKSVLGKTTMWENTSWSHKLIAYVPMVLYVSYD